MLKTLGFLPRRPDLDRKAFREYYERRHAPLALEHIRVFAKYVRNHVVASSPVEPPFDTASEFWFDDAASAQDIGTWLASPAGAVLRDDEAKFMDRSHIAACAVEEHLLLGPARGFESGPRRKLSVMLMGAERPAQELHGFSDALVGRHALRLERAALDLPISPTPPHLPLRAMLWLWPAGPLDLDELDTSGIRDLTVVRIAFDSIETDPARLRDRAS